MKYALAALLLAATPAQAVEIYAGPLGGIGLLNNAGGKNLLLGLEAGVKVTPWLLVGVYGAFHRATGDPTKSLPANSFAFQYLEPSTTVYTTAAEGSYLFEGVLSGLRAGVKAGAAILKTDYTVITISSPSFSSYAWEYHFVAGPHVGYEYPVLTNLTAGVEANALLYQGNDWLRTIDFLGTVRVWF